MASNTKTLLEQIVDGRTDLVPEFVASGNSPKSSVHSVSLIQWCAYHGDVTAIRFLVDQGESLKSLGDNLDLNGAAFHGYATLCEYLIENGADVNHPLHHTAETPLHAALSKVSQPKYDAVVRTLLHYGADPNRKTNNNIETDAFMRDCRTKGETPLHRAAAFGSEEIVQLLLDAGGKREIKDMHGDTPLSWASWYLRPRAILKQLCYGDFHVR